MRCPKCGYISYDHNQICPKCNKDISDEQAKLNLPTYKSNPPSLLGMLTGAGDESNVGFTLDSDAALRDAGVGLDFEETSSMMEGDELDFGKDDQDFEISLTDDAGEFDLPEVSLDEQSGDVPDMDLSSEEDELSLDMDEISFEDSDDTADDLDLDLGEVSIEEGAEEGETADSMDGISPNESIVLEGMSDVSPDESSEETMELGSIPKEDVGLSDEGKPTVELNVSDLKINETGELEISSIPDEIVSPGDLPEEDEINIDEIDIDSEEDLEDSISDKKDDDKNETGSLELSDLTLDASDDLNLDEVGGSDTGEIPAVEGNTAGEGDSLDLGGLAIDEEDESLDLSDLSLDEFDDSDEESFDLSDIALNDNDDAPLEGSLDLDHKETGELKLSDLSENKSEKDAPIDDELNLDLENLDLDLDLGDTGDEK